MNYGSYTLVSELGRGGMGVVHKAQHTVLGTPACVKLLLPEFTRHAEVVARFVNEARAASGMSHDNIVRVLDCNQGPDGVWFIVLEYLEGLPLSKWIRGAVAAHVAPRIEAGGVVGAVTPAQIVRVLVQAANALHTAHEHASERISGIVHRDVKPDNIFLVVRKIGGRANDLHVVLLDFGIAKLRDARGEELTRTGATIGTPSYMAPEQLANSKVVDRRADVYALGVILYEMLTGGWLPWSDENNETPAPAVIYQRQTSEPPPDPRTKNPTVSAALAQVVRRALACDPRERWASALEFARALAEAVKADGVEPAGAEILRKYAEDLWDPADPMFGHRLATPPISLADPALWSPPLSAVSIVGSHVVRPAGQEAGATQSLRPPPPGVPSTTLGSSAAQSVRVAAVPRRSRRALYSALGAVAAAGGLAVVAAIALGGEPTKPGGSGAATAPGMGAPLVDAAVPAMTSVAILTEPVGAAVFIDDELAGTSPVKVALTAGRAVRVRAEHAGHSSTEERHVVGDRAETVRLALAPVVDAAPPIDAGADAATVTRPGRPRPPGRETPSGTKPNETPPAGSGSGFDPENIAQ